MKPSKLARTIEKAVKHGLTLLIKGAPGIGKTDIIKAACERLGAHIIIMHPVVSDPTDFKGLPFVCKSIDGEDVAEFLPFGELRKLIVADELTVVFFDDVGQAPMSVQAALMQLLLERRVNGHQVSDKVVFIAATNDRAHKAGVTGMLEPVKSRFTTILELEPDLDDWCVWAIEAGLPTEVVQFLRFRPKFLFDFEPTKDLVNSPCPRTVHNAAKWLMAEVDGDAEYEVYKGAAGEAFAAEFIGFLKVFRDLPNPDMVILNPETADIPEAPDVMYALCGVLAEKASKQNIDNVVAYANRIPAEFSVMMIKDISVRDKKLANTSKAITEWCVKHSYVLQ